MKIFIFVLYMILTSFNAFGSLKVLDELKIERNYFYSIEDEINKIINNDYTYGAIKIEKYKGTNNSNYKFGSLIAKNIKKHFLFNLTVRICIIRCVIMHGFRLIFIDFH